MFMVILIVMMMKYGYCFFPGKCEGEKMSGWEMEMRKCEKNEKGIYGEW